jgi:hypothetical protein
LWQAGVCEATLCIKHPTAWIELNFKLQTSFTLTIFSSSSFRRGGTVDVCEVSCGDDLRVVEKRGEGGVGVIQFTETL